MTIRYIISFMETEYISMNDKEMTHSGEDRLPTMTNAAFMSTSMKLGTITFWDG